MWATGVARVMCPKTLTPDAALNDLNAALFTDDTAVLHPLVFAAQAFVVLNGTENLRAEEAVTLRLKGSIIDGFRLFYLTVRPAADLIRAARAIRIALKLSGSLGFSKKLKISFIVRPRALR